MTVTIYHKPNCATSRKVLADLKAAGETPKIITYLTDPPDRKRLLQLLDLLGMTPRELLRKKGTPYAELGLDSLHWNDDQLIDFMLAYPLLIDRPIVVKGRRAVLVRPSGNVSDLLKKPRQQKG